MSAPDAAATPEPARTPRKLGHAFLFRRLTVNKTRRQSSCPYDNENKLTGVGHVSHGRVLTPIAHAVQRHLPPLLVAQRLVVLRERPNLPADDAHER